VHAPREAYGAYIDIERLVIALGGNALLQRGQPQDFATQRRNARRAAAAIATVAKDRQIILTHGNGPQIGQLALQNARGAAAEIQPLDVLGAETDGMIGYLLEQELRNVLPQAHIATLLTQIEVALDDPGFQHPSKFIGPVYDAAQAQALAAAHDWSIAQDGAHWRRVVPSPQPRDVLDVSALELLLTAGFIVICAGGGGIPVARANDGGFHGVECVVDKDLTSAMVADKLNADCLVMLTDVAAVYTGWGTPAAAEIRHATPASLQAGSFAAGSMGPKIEAAIRFATATRRACIGALDGLTDILAGRAGTTVKLEETT
jgi:carbamate kinase